MAANKFATILHRNTNKMTLVLIYAVLEWILIILLLVNSLFSYLIIKFADYFGLKPPCLWCSRLDHLFEPGKKNDFRRDLICEIHATEVSKLGYCSNHQKLAESQDMCEDCSSSPKNLAFFQWVNEIGMFQRNEVTEAENGEVGLKCSCCGVSLDRKIYSPYVVTNPSWGVMDYTLKGNHQIEEVDNSNQMIFEVNEGCSVSETNSGCVVLEAENETIRKENSNVIVENPSCGENLIRVFTREDSSVEIPPQHLEFFVGHDGRGLIPVELIDSTPAENQIRYRAIKEEDDENCDNHEDNFNSETGNEVVVELVGGEMSGLGEIETELSSPSDNVIKERAKFAVLESMEIEENETSLIFHPKECDFLREEYEHVEPQFKSLQESDSDVTVEELFQIQVDETDAEVSIGTEIPDLEIPPRTSSSNFLMNDNHCCEEVEESGALKPISVDARDHVVNNQISLGSELNEIEEENKVPDTPTSVESLHHLHNKFLLPEEKRELETEDSFEGSVTSELEGSEGIIMTVEHLKSVLRAERKALHTLYSELEEERSASAVAANQTMAMINRLQEEKAAMQMEAVQYQRMMEEQSEYDQQALQLLNEIVLKREKEKQEVERELELYRKKVFEFEAKEKMGRVLRKSSISKDGSARSDSCSASSSNAGDFDGLSIDLNREVKEEEENRFDRENGDHNTPVDAVLNLVELLAHFDGERLSILEHLKVLEEKLFALTDEEEQHFDEDGKLNGHLSHSNHENGKILAVRAKGKKLLPLLDEISSENENAVVENETNGHLNGFGSNHDVRRIELDHLYERLQTLEADREFLKHCIGSLKKGDKGVDLLQEILHHLRDLRSVELRVRNLSDNALV